MGRGSLGPLRALRVGRRYHCWSRACRLGAHARIKIEQLLVGLREVDWEPERPAAVPLRTTRAARPECRPGRPHAGLRVRHQLQLWRPVRVGAQEDHRTGLFGDANEKGQGIIGLSAKGLESVRKHPLSSNQAPVTTVRGACFQICKLSNKLSTDDGADAAYHQLTRQAHRRHVLTLWDTT